MAASSTARITPFQRTLPPAVARNIGQDRSVPDSDQVTTTLAQRGHEQSGKRPALVLSPQDYNRRTSLLIACPVTSKVKGYPFEVRVSGGGEDQWRNPVRSGEEPGLEGHKSDVRREGERSSDCRNADEAPSLVGVESSSHARTLSHDRVSGTPGAVRYSPPTGCIS